MKLSKSEWIELLRGDRDAWKARALDAEKDRAESADLWLELRSKVRRYVRDNAAYRPGHDAHTLACELLGERLASLVFAHHGEAACKRDRAEDHEVVSVDSVYNEFCREKHVDQGPPIYIGRAELGHL